MKRICLFAGYDSKAVMQEYVVYLLKKLNEVSDVYCCFDVESLSESELEKIRPYVKEVHVERHGKYDFGSWSILLSKLNNEVLAETDELLLVNDSFYGPIFPLSDMLMEMEGRKTDFWGITKNLEIKPHLQSFFLAFRKNVFLSEAFRNFFGTVKKERKKMDIVRNYEISLTTILEDLGFVHSSFYNDETTYNPTVNWMTLIEARVPLIKCSVLVSPSFRYVSEGIYLIPKICEKYDYPFMFIENHLKSKNLKYEDLVFQQMLRTNRFKSWSVAKSYYCGRPWPEKFLKPLVIGILHATYSAVRSVYHCVRSQKGPRPPLSKYQCPTNSE